MLRARAPRALAAVVLVAACSSEPPKAHPAPLPPSAPTAPGAGPAAAPAGGATGDTATAGAPGTGEPGNAETRSADATPVPEPTAADPQDAPAEPGPMAGAQAPEPEPQAPAREDLGQGDGSDVVTIGDSWMSYLLSGGGIEGALDRAGTDYRHYGVAGTTLAGSIPGQYDRALRDDPDIATVIMTGGGNDIMFSGGCNTQAACEESVQMIVDALDALWTRMADDGVQDVVYIRYAEGAGTTPQGTQPDEPPPPPSICLSGRIRCHALDTTELVMGSLLDGIHPTAAANDRIAEGLLALLEAEGIRR